MSKFIYSELVTNHFGNRGRYESSKSVIQTPFKKENRFKEIWRSMYLYPNPNPNEKTPMFGNFYLESDIQDFNLNKKAILEACHYLRSHYQIPYYDMDFFITNRSLWLMVSAKTLGCFGTQKLNLIHKSMATEINQFVQSKGIENPFDLTIYKWNGLIHSLGSYLPTNKNWVQKFSFYDLERAESREEIRMAYFDNGTDFSNLSTVSESALWYQRHKDKVLYPSKEKSFIKTKIRSLKRISMEKFEKRGTLIKNRNLHLYSYSLYLKECGFSLEQAIHKIQVTIQDPYVHQRECVRTIHSAFKGNKHYCQSYVEQFLDEDLRLTDEEKQSLTYEKTSFIIPRSFIQTLNKNKMHYKGYRYLMEILYFQQVERKNFELNIEKERHKREIISVFEKLSRLGLISYALKSNQITASLLYVEKEIYKSHIVIPNGFMKSRFYKESKKELKLLLELLRMSLKTKHGLFFKTKIETLVRNLKSTNQTINKFMHILRKNKILFRNKLFIENPKREFKRSLSTLVAKQRKNSESVSYYDAFHNLPDLRVYFEVLLVSIIKCIYSLTSKKGLTPYLSRLPDSLPT